MVPAARCWTAWSRRMTLRALVEGNDPVSGLPLLVGLRERTVKAFDLTFSAPKAASVLWALGTEPVADVVMGAHREAVATALGFLEERAALARIQVDGVRRHVPTDGWAVAGFVHRTSRAGDPQLHTHCLVPNVVRREDGRCVAIAARPMFVWARAAGSMYQAELQRLLSLRLGVEWQPDRHNTREIAGFTADVLRTFSKRTVEIEAELEADRRPLRGAGIADASRRRSVAGDPPGQGPHRHPGDAVRSVAGRGGRGRPCRSGTSWSVGCVGVTPTLRPSASTRSPGRLVDEDARAVRPFRPVRRTRRDRTRRRARRWPALHRRDHRDRRPVPGVGSGRPAHPVHRGVGMGAGALVDRRPTPPRGRHPRPARPAHRTSRRTRSPTRSSPRQLAAVRVPR